ncbi:MAG: hypothetical protein E6R13_07895 [Spirochaetes bacterium]|nr:MAG: hypothetical protein E6R13_07895 [Spirochaetota bacterium]
MKSNLNKFKTLVNMAISSYTPKALIESKDLDLVEEEFNLSLTESEKSFIIYCVNESLPKIKNIGSFTKTLNEADEDSIEGEKDAPDQVENTEKVEVDNKDIQEPKVRPKVKWKLKKPQQRKAIPVDVKNNETDSKDNEEEISSLWDRYKEYEDQYANKDDLETKSEEPSGVKPSEPDVEPKKEEPSTEKDEIDTSEKREPEGKSDDVQDLSSEEATFKKTVDSIFYSAFEPFSKIDKNKEENPLSIFDDIQKESLENVLTWKNLIEAVNFDNPEELEVALRKKFETDVTNNPKTATIDKDDVVEQILPDTIAPLVSNYMMNDRKLKKSPIVAGKTKEEVSGKIVSIYSKDEKAISMLIKSWSAMHKLVHKGTTSDSAFHKDIINPLYEDYVVDAVKSVFTDDYISKLVQNNQDLSLSEFLGVGVDDAIEKLYTRNGLFKHELEDSVKKHNIVSKTKIGNAKVLRGLRDFAMNELLDKDSYLYEITKKVNDEYVGLKDKTNSTYSKDVREALKELEMEVEGVIARKTSDLSVLDVQDYLHKLAKSGSPLLKPSEDGDGVKTTQNLYDKFKKRPNLSKYDRAIFKALAGKLNSAFSSNKYAVAANGDILRFEDYESKYGASLWSRIKRKLGKGLFRESLISDSGNLIIEKLVLIEDRDYEKEGEYHKTKKQKKNRAKRNNARRRMIRAGKVKKGDNKDIDHKKPLSKNGSNDTSNLRVVPRSKNRSFARNSDGSMK